MTGQVISFFDCCPASCEDQLLVMPASVEEKIITVKESVQTAYTYLEYAARRLSRGITVTAELVCRVVTNRIRAFVRLAVRRSGVQILRSIAILRF